ncbi:hypothetical protein HYV82_05640 [Candidatus Woesearchaeota archaeon]|nr:hypothetical protein [Candidatus Woesearchaeota archaeon]
MLAHVEESVSKLASMMGVYEELANRHPLTEPELEAAKAEMKIIRENILSLIIDAKKGIRRIEEKTRARV